MSNLCPLCHQQITHQYEPTPRIAEVRSCGCGRTVYVYCSPGEATVRYATRFAKLITPAALD
jgi:hypothetical protein